MLIRDKTGGPLMQAEFEDPLGGSKPPMLVADNGRHTIEIDTKHAQEFYRLISATKSEVAQLKKLGYTMQCSDEFEAREG